MRRLVGPLLLIAVLSSFVLAQGDYSPVGDYVIRDSGPGFLYYDMCENLLEAGDTLRVVRDRDRDGTIDSVGVSPDYVKIRKIMCWTTYAGNAASIDSLSIKLYNGTTLLGTFVKSWYHNANTAGRAYPEPFVIEAACDWAFADNLTGSHMKVVAYARE
jgi:hypothetical protein